MSDTSRRPTARSATSGTGVLNRAPIEGHLSERAKTLIAPTRTCARLPGRRSELTRIGLIEGSALRSTALARGLGPDAWRRPPFAITRRPAVLMTLRPRTQVVDSRLKTRPLLWKQCPRELPSCSSLRVGQLAAAYAHAGREPAENKIRSGGHVAATRDFTDWRSCRRVALSCQKSQASLLNTSP
jgi:hypothetical protein